MEEVKQDVKQETAPSVEDVKTQESSNDVNDAVPYKRFKDVNDNYKNLKSEHEKLSARLNEIEENKLIAEGKKDDVIATLKGNNADLSNKVQTLENYVDDERSRLLEKFPEEKRELYASVDLMVLRDMALDRDNLVNKKVGVDNTRGGTTMSTPKNFHDMSDEEKKDPASWSAYLESFKRK